MGGGREGATDKLLASVNIKLLPSVNFSISNYLKLLPSVNF